MKMLKCFTRTGLFMAGLLAIFNQAAAQNIAVEAQVIAGGGGTSAAGQYSLVGTIAQPASWQPVGQAPVVNSGSKTVTVPVNPGYIFYRLRKP